MGLVFRRCRFLIAGAVAIAELATAVACRSTATVPSVDRPPSAELLSPTRDLPPSGYRLRPISSQLLSLTKLSEGWFPYRYNDAARNCTIGYGHLIKKAPCNGTEPTEYLHRLSERRGEEILNGDMVSSRYVVMTSVRVELTDGQFAALSDFVFNCGGLNFKRSTLLKVINTQQEERIPGQFRRWVIAGGKPWPGLMKRREREITEYFRGRPRVREVPAPGEDLSPIDILGEGTQGR